MRAPPKRGPPSRPVRAVTRLAAANSQEIDPDFLEFQHREAQQEQLGWSWD